MSTISILLFLFLISPAAAQPPTPTDNSNYYGGYTGSLSSTVSAIIIVLVISLFLLAFFSIYIRNCSSSSSSSTNNPLRLPTTHTARSRTSPIAIGLPPSLISTFPTFDYSSIKSLHIGKGALECAVCLNEFEDDDTLRLLPKCDHVFHPDCIDMWLVSHTTCPVCRADLSVLGDIPEAGPAPIDDNIIDVMEQPLNPAPLNRSRTGRSWSGRPKWVGMLGRSNSTGHVGMDVERFTLRVTEDVRREIMSGRMNSGVGGSSRRGNRVGEGMRMYGSWAGRSERWGFSLAPPFFMRGASVRSPKVAADDSVHGSTVSGTNLPPV